jgi:hypothetical protein
LTTTIGFEHLWLDSSISLLITLYTTIFCTSLCTILVTMSYSDTTTHGGEASSPPEVGTPNTYYSPEITRNAGGNARAVHRSSVAAGKQPVAPIVVSSEQAASIKPVSRSQAKFLNEVEREHDDFISRYLSVLQYPDGTVSGSDQEVELQNVQARMKEVSILLVHHHPSLPLPTQPSSRPHPSLEMTAHHSVTHHHSDSSPPLAYNRS